MRAIKIAPHIVHAVDMETGLSTGLLTGTSWLFLPFCLSVSVQVADMMLYDWLFDLAALYVAALWL